MIFENLWPLFFLAAIPVIIILYLLKPKGTDYLISSNLLWKKLLRNEQSRTFLEKFVHNLLMYLQILIVLLLTIGLMAPFLRINGQGGERKILLLDTSGSMQHENSAGVSRFKETISRISEYIKASDNDKFSVVTCNTLGTNLLAVDSTDKDKLLALLQGLEPDDCGGDLLSAQSMLDQLAVTNEEEKADLIVCTDSQGISAFENLNGFTDKELWIAGEEVNNVSNDYLAFSLKENGLYDIIVGTTNHSDEAVSFDISLLEEDGSLLSVKQMTLMSNESNICLFSDIDWKGQTCSGLLSGFSFEGGKKDSLAGDNQTYSVKNQSGEITALLVGDGNTYLEKAYQAITGSTIAKAETDPESADYQIRIYDTGKTPSGDAKSILLLGGSEYVSETIKNVVLTTKDCDLTAGLSDFTIGVNTVNVYELPEWAKPFLTYQDKCVGYYGEHDGIREVVTGFDIRESDFPLRAEFPIFLANAMTYLSNTSWLSSSIYYSGEKIAIQPWADEAVRQQDLQTQKAGLYKIGNQDYEEYYTVRFQTATESDGRRGKEADLTDTNAADTQTSVRQVRKTLRNVFLILALLFLAAEWFFYVRQMRYRGKFYPAVRGLVMLLVVLALFGLEISRKSSRITTIFVVDLSNSNAEHQQEISDYLKKTIHQMPSHNEYGIVTFGKNTLVEQFLTKDTSYAGLMTVPEKTATNFEDAVSKALIMIPGEANGRLVLLTDGKQTKGDIGNLAQAVTNSGTELLTLLYDSEQKQDTYIENVILPAYLHPGDLYSVTVIIESNYDTDANLLLYQGSNQAGSSRVHLNKGSNRFVIQQQVTDETMESLRVKIEAEGDSCPENDIFNAYSVVEAPPRVLVISGENAKTGAFTSVLGAAGCEYNVVSPLNTPSDINAMLEYKSIILVDTYIDELPQGFLNNIETYVKDYGCGFICCGGENSFALGGYRDTALETVLPVDMMLRGVNEVPSMAMVMVIDRSGSMLDSAAGSNLTNLDVAVKAATVAVDNLREEDYVGVLTFDDVYSWQVEITQADDRKGIKDKIMKISDGGGTTIKPALQEAYQRIMECDASVKHVVLLTDGMGETDDFTDVIENYSGSGVTLSTVAVGQDSDTRLLEQLAKQCSGRYYYSDTSSDIPKIFAQEVFLGGDSYIQTGNIGLSVYTGHELTKNLFSEGWPELQGYISSTPKPASSSIIVSADKEDPILTAWQYGLGRGIAWNSDVTGEWTAAYSGKEDYVQLWKRIVDYAAGNSSLGEDSVNVVTAGETTEISYFTDDYDSQTQVLANVIDPEGNTVEITLHATAPGRYEADLDTSRTGLYHFNIRRQDEGSITNYMTTAAAVQFSDEYKFDVSSQAYVSFINKYGKIIEPGENIWTQINAKNREKRPLTNILLALSILLFLADVAMRRFQYVPKIRKIRISSMKARQNTPEEKPYGRENTFREGVPGANSEKEDAPGFSAGENQGQDVIKTGQDKKDKKKNEKAKKEKAKKNTAGQTLDTSLLLKKKDDRNR